MRRLFGSSSAGWDFAQLGSHRLEELPAFTRNLRHVSTDFLDASGG